MTHALDTTTSPPSLERALSRITGAQAFAGNRVVLLEDARENYPAWLSAIRSAHRTVHFENFIIADDETGRMFAEALIERARAGIAVRVIYDWLGCTMRADRRYWRVLEANGVEVRVFNPLSLFAPAWFQRDHRKIVVVDGEIGFVSGLCISDLWKGRREGAEPWRDTGVAISGPAVADLERGFAESWALCGAPLPRTGAVAQAPAAGEATVRIAIGRPGEQRAYRLDILTAAAARDRLWITDAYFVPTRAYRQALAEAAADGVDVRLLVPGNSDVPFLPALVRAGYRPLLETGVRIYEWSGTMLHAKTAVADGRLARVGSTNLNPTSWFGNYEIDAVIEDKSFAAGMETMFLRDLARAAEVGPARRSRRWRRTPAGFDAAASVQALPSAALGLHHSARAALTKKRKLTRLERRSLVILVGLLLLAAGVAMAVPSLVVAPVVVTCLWIAIALCRRLVVTRRRRRRGTADPEAAPLAENPVKVAAEARRSPSAPG